MPTKVQTSIMNNGQSVHFDAEGLGSYETDKLHSDLVQQATQIRQQHKESQLIRLIAFSQFLLFLLCGFLIYGQLRASGGNDHKDSQQSYIQHQPERGNRV